MTKIITIEESLYYEAECYKHRWLIELISRSVEERACAITNMDRLQRRVQVYVGRYLKKNANNIKNRAFIRRLVFNKLEESIKRYQSQDVIYYEGFNNENEETSHYEPPDILANVEYIIERRSNLKGLIDTLASGDSKKRTVLTALASGYNDSQTADILANVCGGKSSGHRSFIKRFKKQCREALA